MTTTAKRKTANRSIYGQLLDAVDPIVTHYRDDLLVHDNQALRENPGMPFLHFARECGTHLWFLEPADKYPPKGVRVPHLFGTADRDELVESTLSAVRYCVRSENTQSAHYYDGQRLRRVTLQQAMDIAQAYAQRVWREFK